MGQKTTRFVLADTGDFPAWPTGRTLSAKPQTAYICGGPADRAMVSVLRRHLRQPLRRSVVVSLSSVLVCAAVSSGASWAPPYQDVAAGPSGAVLELTDQVAQLPLSTLSDGDRQAVASVRALPIASSSAAVDLSAAVSATSEPSLTPVADTSIPADVSTPASASSILRNGGFDEGIDGWFLSYLSDRTTADVITDATDAMLEVNASTSQGSVAQDVAVEVSAGRQYSAAIRAVSPSGSPVLVELAVHAMTDEGTIGQTNSRLVMVEGYEVPITTMLVAASDQASIRVEIYVHTTDQSVRLDDATLLVDGSQSGPNNYGYQQPRVRYLHGAEIGNLEAGQQYTVEISVDTTTDQVWTCCDGEGAIRLGTEDADLVGGSALASELFVAKDVDGSNWLSPTRIAFDRERSTIGGSFTTLITAPSHPGPFFERFRLVAEGVTWVPGPVIEVIGSVVEPAVEAPDIDIDDGTADLIVDCPTTVGIDDPPPPPDCATEIDGFFPMVTDIRAGAFTLNWGRPEEVAVNFYLIEVQDRDGPITADPWADADVFSTSELSIDISRPPGFYRARVVALGEAGQWQRSPEVEVEIITSSPIVEADRPPFGCPDGPPVVGIGFPGLCPPPAEDDPLTEDDKPIDEKSDCEAVLVTFDRDMLMRYRGSDRSSHAPVQLPCSRYEVRLRSSDERHTLDYQLDQDEERWFLEGLNRDDEVIYSSDPTPDLSDHQTEAVFSAGVSDLDGVVAFRARHVGLGQSANSIQVAATLVPVD